MSLSKHENTYNNIIKYLKNIEAQSETLQKSDKITIIFDDYEIECCKVALEQADFFHSLFGNPEATFSETSKGRVVLKHEEVNLESLAKVLEFLYDTFDEHVDEHGNKITDYAEKKLDFFMNLQNFQSIFIVAHFLQVKRIIETCCKFIMEKSDVTNIFDVFNLAQTFDLHNVTEFCKLFFGFHFERILKTDDFLNAPTEVIAQILSLEQMKVQSEDVVLKALSNWISYKEFKFKKSRQIDLIRLLLPHIRKNQVSESAKKRFIKKKWASESDWDLINFNKSKRFWPKLLMITKVPNNEKESSESENSDESNDYLDDLWSGANEMPQLFWEFFVKDLETNSWIESPLTPLSNANSSVKRATIIGNWDNIFVVSLLETSSMDTSRPNVSINYANMQENKWRELKPTFPHQLTISHGVKAVFGDNTLFLLGRTPIDLNLVGFMINFDELEPEWRGFPIPLENLKTFVYSVVYSPGNVWIVTSERKRGKSETGNKMTINTVCLPDVVPAPTAPNCNAKCEQLPGFCSWSKGIVAVGGDMAAKSCYQFGGDQPGRGCDKLPNLNKGRATPAVVSEGEMLYAVGGFGFFWHENEESIEVYDQSTNNWSLDEDAPKFDAGGYKAFVVNKPIRMFLNSAKDDFNFSCLHSKEIGSIL